MQISKEIKIDVNMNDKFLEMFDRMDKEEDLKSFIYSVCESYSQNVPDELNKNEKIMLGILSGWVANDIFSNVKQNLSLKNVLSDDNSETNLYDYKCKLEDGTEFVITTNNQYVIDNTLNKKVQEITGKRVVSPFTKLSKEEGDKLHKKVLDVIKSENLDKEGI